MSINRRQVRKQKKIKKADGKINRKEKIFGIFLIIVAFIVALLLFYYVMPSYNFYRNSHPVIARVLSFRFLFWNAF